MLATRKICATTLSRSACRSRPLKGFNSGRAVVGGSSSSAQRRAFSHTGKLFEPLAARKLAQSPEADASYEQEPMERPEHAVISTFDLFSIGGESWSCVFAVGN